jgi:hypothetical protein
VTADSAGKLYRWHYDGVTYQLEALTSPKVDLLPSHSQLSFNDLMWLGDRRMLWAGIRVNNNLGSDPTGILADWDIDGGRNRSVSACAVHAPVLYVHRYSKNVILGKVCSIFVFFSQH